MVPEISIFIKQYIDGKKNNSESPKGFDCWMDQINYWVYLNGEHKIYYDGEKLTQMLNKSGFKRIDLRDFDAELDMDYHKSY